MTIKIEKEPKSISNAFSVYEHCFFCRKPTNYWNTNTNNPVCVCCANKYDESQLPLTYLIKVK